MRVAATIALALFAVLPAAPAQSQEEGCRERLPTDRTTIDLRGAEVQTSLRLLADRFRINLIVTPDATGLVIVSLYDVPVRDAFDTLVRTGGLVCVVRGDILVVMPVERLRKEAEAAREQQRKESQGDAEARKKQVEARREEMALAELQTRGPLREDSFRVAYADPGELVQTLQGILGLTGGGVKPCRKKEERDPEGGGSVGGPPLIAAPPFSALYGTAPQAPGAPAPTPTAEVLAKGITIQAHCPTNSLFIRHYEADLERIKKLIREKLDMPLPQVKIIARLNELNREDFFALGVSWGGATLRGINGDILVGQGFAGRVAPAAGGLAPVAPGVLGGAASNPALTLSNLLPISALTGLPLGGNIVDFPTAGGTFGTPAGLAFGFLTRKLNINLILDALEAQNKTNSLARPEIVTIENNKAMITLGSEIPYATVSSAGTSVQFKDALLKLEVTPTVIREGDTTRVKMLVNVENNSKGADVPTTGGGSVPAIDKRTAKTEVIVQEGETLAIGGIRQRQQIESIRKVPFLGDIPVLGYLFRARSTTTSPNREMVVFITPYVLKSDVAQASPPPATPPK